jgi:hypothetical protein
VVLQGAQEIGVGAVVRGDPCGICQAARCVESAQGAIGETVLQAYRGVAQLTTPVQRIDRSRLGEVQRPGQPLTGNVGLLHILAEEVFIAC